MMINSRTSEQPKIQRAGQRLDDADAPASEVVDIE